MRSQSSRYAPRPAPAARSAARKLSCSRPSARSHAAPPPPSERVRLARRAREVLRVTAFALIALARLLEPLRRVLADRLEHPVAPVGEADEALLDERLERVEVGVGRPPRRPRACSRRRRRRGARRAAAPRSRAARSDHSIVARSVCWRGSASRPPLSRSSRCESRSRICSGVRALVRAAASSTASGRLSRRRQSSAIVVARLELRALAEERDCLALGERRHRVLDLALDAQQLAARDEQMSGSDRRVRSSESSGAASITCSRLSSSSSSSRSPMCSASPSLAPSVCAIVSVTSAGSRSVASPTQKTPALYSGTSVGRGLDREPRLARAAGPGQRDETRAVLEPRQHLEQLVVSAHERARRTRQVRVGDRLQRREGAVAELEDRDRLGDVLEPVLAEVGDARRRRARVSSRERTTWPPCAGGRDARSEVDVVADVALLADVRRAGVQADAYPRSAPSSARFMPSRPRPAAPGAVGKA